MSDAETRSGAGPALPVHVAVVLGLGLGSLDAALAISGSGAQSMSPTLTGLLPLAAGAHLGLWTFVGWPLCRLRGLAAAPVIVALATSLGSIGVLMALPGLFDVDSARALSETRRGWLQLGVLGAFATGVGWITHRALAGGAFPAARLATLARLVLAGGFVLFAFACSVWWAELGRGARGIGATRFLPWFGIVALASLAVWRLRATRSLLALAYGAALLAVVGPPLLARPEGGFRAVPADADGPKLVILLTVDTLRRDALSIYSEDARRTPAFDALARDGVIFERAIAPAPWTLPSLASVLSGVPETVHRATPKAPRLPKGIRTVAAHFRADGYRTAAIGSNPWIALGGLARDFEETRLFPKTRYESAGSALFGTPETRDANTEELTDLALSWLDASQGARAFLWLHYFDPHSPYAPPAYLLDDTEAGLTAFDDSYRIMNGSWQAPAKQKERIRALYQAEVQRVDRALARVVGRLKETGRYEEALIVLLSDHGEEFWEHGRGFHGHILFEEMIRVPLLVKLPASVAADLAGSRVSRAVSTVQVAPTLLEWSDLAPGDTAVFHPALPLRPESGEETARPDDVAIVSSGTEYFERRRSLRYGDEKLIEHLDSDRVELYDLAVDPGERCDLAARAPERVAALSMLLEAHDARAAATRVSLGLVSSEGPVVSDEMREALEALGYVE
jgi:arylsulfatase A-like enzyme